MGLDLLGSDANPVTGRFDLTGIRSFVSWHYFRDADAKHDEKAARRYLFEIVAMKPTDEAEILEIVPALKHRGLDEDARGLFRAAYSTILSSLDADPVNCTFMNRAAWLCANCDEHLDKAAAMGNQCRARLPG